MLNVIYALCISFVCCSLSGMEQNKQLVFKKEKKSNSNRKSNPLPDEKIIIEHSDSKHEVLEKKIEVSFGKEQCRELDKDDLSLYKKACGKNFERALPRETPGNPCDLTISTKGMYLAWLMRNPYVTTNSKRVTYQPINEKTAYYVDFAAEETPQELFFDAREKLCILTSVMLKGNYHYDAKNAIELTIINPEKHEVEKKISLTELCNIRGVIKRVTADTNSGRIALIVCFNTYLIDDTVFIITLDGLKIEKKLQCSGSIRCVTFTPDGTMCALMPYTSREISLRPLTTKYESENKCPSIEYRWRNWHMESECIKLIEFDASGKRLIVVSERDKEFNDRDFFGRYIKVWDVSNLSAIKLINEMCEMVHRNGRYKSQDLAVTSKGNVLHAGHDLNDQLVVSEWDIGAGKKVDHRLIRSFSRSSDPFLCLYQLIQSLKFDKQNRLYIELSNGTVVICDFSKGVA